MGRVWPWLRWRLLITPHLSPHPPSPPLLQDHDLVLEMSHPTPRWLATCCAVSLDVRAAINRCQGDSPSADFFFFTGCFSCFLSARLMTDEYHYSRGSGGQWRQEPCQCFDMKERNKSIGLFVALINRCNVSACCALQSIQLQ